jgi:hypothetical protein
MTREDALKLDGRRGVISFSHSPVDEELEATVIGYVGEEGETALIVGWSTGTIGWPICLSDNVFREEYRRWRGWYVDERDFTLLPETT